MKLGLNQCILLFSCTVLFSGCTSDCSKSYSKEHYYYYLTESEKANMRMIANTDTIVLIGQTNDTCVLATKGTSHDFELGSELECSVPNKFEYYTNIYSSFRKNQFIDWIDYGIGCKKDYNGATGFSIKIVDDYMRDAKFNCKISLVKDSSYTDTVTINGKLVYGMTLTSEGGSKVLYNHHYGILRIQHFNKIYTASF